MYNELLGKKVIIRGNRSGVFFGTLNQIEGQNVELLNCRRIWYWSGANSISQLAVDGTNNPNNCKFTVSVEQIAITDVIEVIPCTEKAIESIEAVDVWRL